MAEKKKHGRRRAGAPKRSNSAMQKTGTLLLTGSLLVTITSPALAGDEAKGSVNANGSENSGITDTSAKRVINAASDFLFNVNKNGPITADPNAKLTFTMSSISSEPGPDSKLKAELEENAKKDAEAAAYAKAHGGDTPVKPLQAGDLKADAEKAGNPEEPSQSVSVNPETPSKLLSAPLKDLIPSSSFGIRVSPITGAVDEFHRGQDYAAACGTEVMVAAGGTVVFSQWHQYGGGNRVEVDHGNGLITTYNHLSASKVKVGQKVTRGEVIALSGTTGASTGCHLHFEVEINKKVVNPLPWL